jgi:class 3 adenylate cyclase
MLCPNFNFCSALRAVTPAGSEYKIDASYLSPNVNLASRLEAATKQYGCPLLLSRDFVDCVSPAVRAKVRRATRSLGPAAAINDSGPLWLLRDRCTLSTLSA